jgi:hypothetical protein
MIEHKSNVEFLVLYADGTWQNKTLEQVLVAVSYPMPVFNLNATDYFETYTTLYVPHTDLEQRCWDTFSQQEVIAVKLINIVGYPR